MNDWNIESESESWRYYLPPPRIPRARPDRGILGGIALCALSGALSVYGFVTLVRYLHVHIHWS